VVWEDRVFAVSDDGFLYCLAAKDGALLWKRRGGPTDSMLLGNGRMVSRWPARGGPVVADGVVYFAAGIWPSEGIFLYALDAKTGEVLWLNDSSGGITMPQPHGGAVAKSGVSAEGYLVVSGDRLLVPTGRAVPAVFSRSNGELLYFHLQAHGGSGGSAIVAAGSHYFHSGCIYDTAGGHFKHKGVVTSVVAASPRHIIYAAGDEIRAIERAKMWTQQETVDRKGQKTTKTVLSSPVWRMKTPHRADTLIAADATVVIGTAGRVSVLDPASQKTLLTAEVDGVPYGLAVAGGRLYVSTDKGTIYCFDGSAAGPPSLIEPETAAFPYADTALGAAAATAAEQIVRRTGVTEGYCLDLACGDGALAHALAERTKLHIYAVDPDPEKVARARLALDRAGLYGVRVTVHQGDPAGTSYPNYFANLIVSGRSLNEGPGAAPVGEMNRLLRPYGGTACIGKPDAMKVTVRGELDGAGTWTHQYCDAANTLCSTDTLVKGPLCMLWFTDFGFQMPSRHGRGPAPLCLDGRLFVEGRTPPAVPRASGAISRVWTARSSGRSPTPSMWSDGAMAGATWGRCLLNQRSCSLSTRRPAS
jgi:SAM-dependent methyltransferase